MPYDITYIWDLKNNTNKCICKTEINSETQKASLWVPEKKREGVRTNQGSMSNRYKLLHVKQTSNKDLPYSMEQYTQYLAITYNEIQYAKILDHYAVHVKLTQYCKSTKLNKTKLLIINYY